MTKRPFKIAIAGTHSTGKSTFVSKVGDGLKAQGIRAETINDLATRARALGFPILAEHTYESTLWIMAECMRQEAEASLKADVILVDRPVPDALGYLLAALEVSGRSIEDHRLSGLRQIAAAHVHDYDHLVLTVLDPNIALGEGRDTDTAFRAAADRNVTSVIEAIAPGFVSMSADNSSEVVEGAVERARRWVGAAT